MKNKRLKTLRELQGMVLGIEMNLKLLEDDLDAVSRNIIYLNKIEGDLVYNINLHRSNEVISVVTEYRKSINELGMVRKKITEHKWKKQTIENRLKKKMESYDYYLKELEAEYDRVNSEPVILLFRRDKDE